MAPRIALSREPGPARDAGIDSLRGLMLVAMALNHITSLLQVVTDHPLGYASSAEVFVFLSGLVAGLVYTRRIQRDGPRVAAAASFRRAATIYRHHLGLFVGLLLWTQGFSWLAGHLPANAPPAMLQHPLVSLVTGAGLIYQPPLLDILPMYAGFMLVLPFVLTAILSGRRTLVAGASLLLWAATDLICANSPLVHGVVQIGAFNWGAWQLLFVLGVGCGYAKTTNVPTSPPASPALVAAVIGLCGYTFLIRHRYIPAPFPAFADWVNKNNLAPIRLANTLALFWLVHLAYVRWPGVFRWPALALLGRHSLAVFGTHVAAAYVLYAFPEYVSATPARTWIGSALMLASLFATALWCERRQRRPASRTASSRTAADVASPACR